MIYHICLLPKFLSGSRKLSYTLQFYSLFLHRFLSCSAFFSNSHASHWLDFLQCWFCPLSPQEGVLARLFPFSTSLSPQSCLQVRSSDILQPRPLEHLLGCSLSFCRRHVILHCLPTFLNFSSGSCSKSFSEAYISSEQYGCFIHSFSNEKYWLSPQYLALS